MLWGFWQTRTIKAFREGPGEGVLPKDDGELERQPRLHSHC